MKEEAVERVTSIIRESAIVAELRSLSQSTATAAMAAEALSVSVDQIAKSIVVGNAERLVIVVLRGGARVSLEKVAAATGARLKLLGREDVLRRTGFAAGGVAPVGSLERSDVLIDRGLMEFPEVWVARGSHLEVFGCAPGELVKLSNGAVCDVTEY